MDVQVTQQSSLPAAEGPEKFSPWMTELGVRLRMTVRRNMDRGCVVQEAWVCVPMPGAYRWGPGEVPGGRAVPLF